MKGQGHSGQLKELFAATAGTTEQGNGAALDYNPKYEIISLSVLT